MRVLWDGEEGLQWTVAGREGHVSQYPPFPPISTPSQSVTILSSPDISHLIVITCLTSSPYCHHLHYIVTYLSSPNIVLIVITQHRPHLCYYPYHHCHHHQGTTSCATSTPPATPCRSLPTSQPLQFPAPHTPAALCPTSITPRTCRASTPSCTSRRHPAPPIPCAPHAPAVHLPPAPLPARAPQGARAARPVAPAAPAHCCAALGWPCLGCAGVHLRACLHVRQPKHCCVCLGCAGVHLRACLRVRQPKHC